MRGDCLELAVASWAGKTLVWTWIEKLKDTEGNEELESLVLGCDLWCFLLVWTLVSVGKVRMVAVLLTKLLCGNNLYQ